MKSFYEKQRLGGASRQQPQWLPSLPQKHTQAHRLLGKTENKTKEIWRREAGFCEINIKNARTGVPEEMKLEVDEGEEEQAEAEEEEEREREMILKSIRPVLKCGYFHQTENVILIFKYARRWLTWCCVRVGRSRFRSRTRARTTRDT